jgi:hypothetical protein
VQIIHITTTTTTTTTIRCSATSNLPKKICSLEKALVLPPVFDSDGYEVLRVQLDSDKPSWTLFIN